MAQSPAASAPQQGDGQTPVPPQQGQQTGPVAPQQGQPIFRDWAAI